MQGKGLYSFRPFKLGPYSTEIYRDISWLKFEGVIQERIEAISDGTKYSSFSLTPKGTAEVERLLTDPGLTKIYQRIANVKMQLANMPLERLLDQVHQEYPDYRQEY